jgi:peptide/nickel transport system ATP-binding protein
VSAPPTLHLEDVSVGYRSEAGLVRAVSHVDLEVMPGSIVGLVGESGSGKSTLAMAVMRLLRGNARLLSGRVTVSGRDVYGLTPQELRQFRGERMAMVFQGAMNVLNPVRTVEEQMRDGFTAHRPHMSRQEVSVRIDTLLDMVGIARRHRSSYPHELSGGMKQRIVIAIALSLEPDLVIMDEPTTALDVVAQRAILDQIRDIQRARGFAVLFISHDFGLVRELASRVAIMYAGRLVEVTDAALLGPGRAAHHPYTDGLMRAIPQLTADEVSIEGIPGHPPDLIQLPPGCAYHPRCPAVMPVCMTTVPAVQAVDGRLIACHRFNPAIAER